MFIPLILVCVSVGMQKDKMKRALQKHLKYISHSPAKYYVVLLELHVMN